MLMLNWRDGNRPKPVSLPQRIRSSTRAWARWRASRNWIDRAGVAGVGGEDLVPGEVISVWAFGISWLLASRDLAGTRIGYHPPSLTEPSEPRVQPGEPASTDRYQHSEPEQAIPQPAAETSSSDS